MSSTLPGPTAGRLALTVALGVVLGCASGLERGDRLFAARAYPDAVVAYEKSLSDGASGAQLERILFYLALAHATPESPTYDEDRARELLQELVERLDTGPYRAQAIRILELEALEDDLREEARRRRREADESLAQAAALGQDAQHREAALEELRDTLEQLEREITECRDQLEKLKAIDLDDSF